MKIVEPQVELWKQKPTLEGVWHQIARATRVCYQSKPREDENDEAFVNRVILKPATRKDGSIDFDKCHGAMLEHGTIYLTIPIYFSDHIHNYISNKYSRVLLIHESNKDCYAYVTTNMRVILENNWQDDLMFIHSRSLHIGRTTFSVITDIGVTRELNRHRTFSIAEQSTRYCDLTKDKFGDDIMFIQPNWLGSDVANDELIKAYTHAELYYKALRKLGYRPEQARQVLPLGLKTQAVYTAFSDDWEHFLRLRADNVSGKVHPNMQLVAKKIKEIIETL